MFYLFIFFNSIGKSEKQSTAHFQKRVTWSIHGIPESIEKYFINLGLNPFPTSVNPSAFPSFLFWRTTHRIFLKNSILVVVGERNYIFIYPKIEIPDFRLRFGVSIYTILEGFLSFWWFSWWDRCIPGILRILLKKSMGLSRNALVWTPLLLIRLSLFKKKKNKRF